MYTVAHTESTDVGCVGKGEGGYVGEVESAWNLNGLLAVKGGG